MNTLLVAALGAAGLLARPADDPWVVYPPSPGPAAGKRVVIVTGDEEYRSEESGPMLAQILAARHGFHATVLFAVDPASGRIDPWEQTHIPGLHLLRDADVVVLNLRFRELPDEQMRHLAEAIDAGKGLVAIRPTCAAFQFRRNRASPFAAWSFDHGGPPWRGGFGQEVLGLTWIAHHGAHGRESTRGVVEPGREAHPILRGVQDVWGPTDVYEVGPLPPDAEVLLRGQVLAGMTPADPPVAGRKNDPMMPLAWTRRYVGPSGRASRVFYTSLGASVDFQNEGLRRLFVNACYWAAGLQDRIPEKADVEPSGPYDPSFYSLAPRPRPLDLRPSDFRAGAGVPPAPRLELRRGDRVALTGNALAERLGALGHFETLLHSRFPDLELSVRNFGWPGDEAGLRKRPDAYATIDDPYAAFAPQVVLAFFGYNESFRGPAGLEAFKADLEQYLASVRASTARVALVSPIAFEDAARPDRPDAAAHNARLRACAEAARDVARRLRVPFADLFTPTLGLFAEKAGLDFTVDGAHLDARGGRAVGLLLDRALFGPGGEDRSGSPAFERLREAVVDKDFVHRQDYRMVNGWYVYGGRRAPYDLKTFPEEFAKLRRMVAARDRRVWELARGRLDVPPPDDAASGALSPVATAFGTKRYSEPAELRYLTPEESLRSFTTAPGYRIELVAAEDRFPALANPAQINFDGRGRLWTLALPGYPQWRPGDPYPDDKLLIAEDDDRDGRADRVKVFAGGLHCPIGFEFWNGGVLVAQPPRLLFLKDLDGDDVADVREVLLDGFGSEDTHVGIAAPEWDPSGRLLLLEGVAKSTTVETIHGPVRRATPTIYRFDPRSLRLEVFSPSFHPNPWGYVHDRWGQGFLVDGTTGAAFWTAPFSGAAFPGRRGIDEILRYSGTRLRPAVGAEFVSSRHFPDDAQGEFLFGCVINLNGIPRFRLRDDGAGYLASRAEDLVVSADRNFRPVDPQFGPDGALYFGDWHTPLIGHMQYSQRDPHRDHVHGRLYRVVARGRPFVEPQLQAGKGVDVLLDQLGAYEDRTRYRARRELRDRDAAGVLPALERRAAEGGAAEAWLLEALWVRQGLQAGEGGLLKRLLASADPRLRAAALRAAGEERGRDVLELLARGVADAEPRPRLEAVRALSFFPEPRALELALEAAKRPLDAWLDYTLASTLGALEPVWKGPLAKGEPLAASNPAGAAYLRAFAKTRRPAGPVEQHLRRLLAPDGLTPELRKQAVDGLAKAPGRAEDGAAVFRRLCTACHKAGPGEGVDFGPDLSQAGARLSKAQLIESILFPNEQVDPKYQTLHVTTAEGDVLSGFVESETDSGLALRVAGGTLVRLEKKDVRRRERSGASSMPEGLVVSLAAQEFADLVEFLATRR